METKKNKLILSTLYGTMASSPSARKEVNSPDFRPFSLTATPGLVYADTDAIHCDFSSGHIKGIMVQNGTFAFWKV